MGLFISELHVAVAYGGVSPEHEISVQSGQAVLETLSSRSGIRLTGLFIDPCGDWHLSRIAPDVAVCSPASPADGNDPLTPAMGLERLTQWGVELVFIALHGPGGEDGTFQSLLSAAGLPHTGSSAAASALTMDKHLTKAVVASHGQAVPREVLLEGGDRPSLDGAGLERIVDAVGLPCFVKPNACGSSVATRCAPDREVLRAAITAAAEVDLRGDVLIEERVQGRELSVGVIGPRGAEESLPAVEIRPVGRPFFDWVAKYSPGAAEEICPAVLDGRIHQRLRSQALEIHRLLGCEGMSRVDFILRDDEAVFLELNSIPGLTRKSLLPKMAAAAGSSFTALIEKILAAARTRGAGGAR